MADFDVTAPDGRTFTVTAPDGAPQDQVLAYAKAQFEKMPKEPSTFEKVAKVANAAATLSPMGVLAKGGEMALHGLDKVAYEAGGKVTDLTGSPAAGTAANLVTQAVPAAVGGAVGKVVQGTGALRTGAEALMQSALKPSVKALKNQGATGINSERAINTMLDEGISVSRGGIAKGEAKVDALSSAITDALNNSGATVDKNAVASRLQDVISKIERTDLHPQKRVQAVEDVYNEVLAAQNLPRQIPVARANEIKQGIYQKLKDKYGELGSDAVESEKALARGLKEEISAKIPEISKLNKQESDLINALELVKHRAYVTGNKDIGGLAWLTANPARFAAFMADRSPLFKSIVARMMNTASEKAPELGAAAGYSYPQARQ